MTKSQKEYYCRFAQFAIDCAILVGKLDWRIASNKEYGRQLIRSSSSVGANYIEAIEGVSDVDFVYRFGICRKESNESVHWLFLIKMTNNKEHHQKISKLTNEGREFVKMFTSAIQTKRKNINKDSKKRARMINVK